MQTKITNTADRIIEKLKAEGIHILRYDAYSSNSVYLKLDYGVAHSVRISDHTGKKHLKYRYNIQSVPPEESLPICKQTRYWYDFDHVNECIEQIKNDRNEKLKQYGSEKYKAFMEQNRLDGQYKKGFWQQARQV